MTRSHGFLSAVALVLVALATGCPTTRDLAAVPQATPTPTPAGGATPVPSGVGALNLAYADMPVNSWTVGSPMAHERVGPSSSVLNDRLYVIGGDGEATMERYDPLEDAWQLLPLATTNNRAEEAYAPNRTRYFGAAIASGGRLFYVGGTSNSLLPVIDVYDPDAHAWMDLASPYLVNARFARMAHAGVSLDGVLHLIGGLMQYDAFVPEPTTDVLAVSTATRELYEKAPLPAPRAGLGAGVLDHRVLVVGGYSRIAASAPAEATSSMLAYSAGDWSAKTPSGAALAALNVPRHSFGSAVMNGKWYVAGGVDSAGQVLDSIEEYDPATNAWQLKAPMRTPRVHLALGAVGGRLYALGGYDAQNRQLRSVDVFRP